MLEVTHAHHVDGYKVRLVFNNGETGIVDLDAALWGPVFEPLRDPAVFRRFAVSAVLHTLAWDNGADFAPEFLYDMMLEQAGAHTRI